MRSHEEAEKEMDKKVIEAITCTMKRDYDGAISIISNILETETYDDLRCDAYGYRAGLLEKLGKLDGALEDWLTSYSLIEPNPFRDLVYRKYVTELRIGGVYEKQSKMQEALEWYRKALKTIIEGEGTSGSSALKSFIEMIGEDKLTEEDRNLCNEVVIKSWELMQTLGRIEGEPDMRNLLGTVEEISKAESKPLPKD